MRADLPTESLHAIRVSTWHALFAARGYPAGITSSTDSLDAIALALSRADLSLPLARALFTIAAFATESARADIYNAADALAYAARWPDAASPADLVALLLAASATDDRVAEVIEAAQILRDRSFRPLTTHVYVGAREVEASVGEPTQYVDPLRAAVSAWAASRDFGEVVAIDARTEPGAIHYVILHEDRVTTVVAATSRATSPAKGAARLTSTSHRALRSHQITYEPAARRLWVTTDCMEAVTPLATIAGRVLFDDPRHFLDAQAVDLWRLQELGAAALTVPALSAKVTMTAVGGTWHSGKSHAITPRGRDFFKALARYKIRIEGGSLDLVTLRAKLAPRGASPGAPAQCDVALRPPHLLTVSEPELAPLMREFLDAAKITSPDPRPADFYSMQPWIAPPAEWIAREGEEGFAQLVANGLLVADRENRAVAHPDHAHAGRTATAHPLRGTKFLAWSADATLAPFVIDEKDLVVYALSFTKLARTVADALGLEGPAAALDDDGVLFCGRRTLGPTYALLFLLTRPIRPATVVRLRDAAAHGHAVLITPAGRMREQGLREIALPKLAGPWTPLLGALVRALHLETYVDTTLYAPEGARVVLHRETARAWIDGVLCVAFTELHFHVLEILVMHAGQPVHTKVIASHIAEGHVHEDTTRRAIEALVAAIAKSFKVSKKKPPKDLTTLITKPRHGSYQLNATGFVD